MSNEQWQACLDIAMTKSKSAKLIIKIQGLEFFCRADGFIFIKKEEKDCRGALYASPKTASSEVIIAFASYHPAGSQVIHFSRKKRNKRRIFLNNNQKIKINQKTVFNSWLRLVIKLFSFCFMSELLNINS